MLAGQAIAVSTRTGTTGPITYYYLFNDHLGSASTMTTTAGSVVHQARFLPFGGSRGWTSAPTTAWLDRGYTGHLHNDEVGLIYMNARYYVPSLGRFASADTIVPDPTNPQQFNRFSYVLNNPILLTDPSGHCAYNASLGDGYVNDQECWNLLWGLESSWGVDIVNEDLWNIEHLQELQLVLNSFADLLGGADIVRNTLDRSAQRAGQSKFVVKGSSAARPNCTTGCSNYGFVEFYLDETFRSGRGTAGSLASNSAADPIAARTTIAHEFSHILYGLLPDGAYTDYMNLRGWQRPNLPDGSLQEKWVARNGANPIYGWPENPHHHLVHATALYIAGDNTWNLVSLNNRRSSGLMPLSERLFIGDIKDYLPPN